jgi:cystathionine beta-lyase/cystathionine gamma-synthase
VVADVPRQVPHRGPTGVTQGLVRVSVGIENWRDLLREYTEALDAI